MFYATGPWCLGYSWQHKNSTYLTQLGPGAATNDVMGRPKCSSLPPAPPPPPHPELSQREICALARFNKQDKERNLQTLGFHGNYHFRCCVVTIPKKLFPIYIWMASQNQIIVSHRFPCLLDMEPKKVFLLLIEILGFGPDKTAPPLVRPLNSHWNFRKRGLMNEFS